MATQKKKKPNPFYEGIMAGLRNAIDYEKGLPVDAVISIRDVDLPEPPDPMTARDIAALRRKFRVSQKVFASLINASPQTVHAWEQGRKSPSGPALKLLRMIEHKPELLKLHVA